MARQETETYVVLDAPLNPNYGGRHIALPINDHDEACAELVLLRARLTAVERVCDEIELGVSTAGMLGGEEHDIELVRMTVKMVRAALTEGAGENATLDA